MNATSATANATRPSCTVKNLLDALKPMKRHSRGVWLHAEREHGVERFERDRAIFEVRTKFRPYDEAKSETTVVTKLPGWVGNGYCDATTKVESEWGSYLRFSKEESNVYEPASGFWGNLDDDRLVDLLTLLPKDALLTMRIRFDNYDTGTLPEKGVHADDLLLEARWWRNGKEKRASFLLGYTVGAHNTARFGK